MNRFLQSLVVLCLVLTAALVVLSAYIRLDHAGLGCDGWPACYGRIGAPQAAGTDNAYARIAAERTAPTTRAGMAHRLIAGLLGLAVLALTLGALARRRRGAPVLMPLLLLALTVFLAGLGLGSGGLQQPARVLGNLFGGFTMLALLWLLWLRGRQYAGGGYASRHALRVLLGFGLGLLIAQLLFGALTSANFAALACTTFPDCHGAWLPDGTLLTAFDIFRTLPLNAAGVVNGGPETQSIHLAHRLGAALTLLVVGTGAVAAIRAGGIYRDSGITVLVLLLAEIALGVTAVYRDLPIALATAHNGLAALLLLSLLSLHHKARTAALGNASL